jgi:DNA-binding CsgD family transcriptional regulator
MALGDVMMTVYRAPLAIAKSSSLPHGDGALQRLFEKDRDAQLIVCAAGRLILANAAARRFLEAGLFRCVPDAPLRLGSPECSRRFIEAVQSSIHPPFLWRRHVLRLCDGTWRAIDFYGHDQRDEDTLVHVIVRRPSGELQPDIEPLGYAFGLTPTEQRVLARIAEAQTPKNIAAELRVSTHTVRAHLRAIYAKMGVRGKAAAQSMALALMA